jgi:hypothetical protein
MRIEIDEKKRNSRELNVKLWIIFMIYARLRIDLSFDFGVNAPEC